MPLTSLPIEVLTRILEFVVDACPLTEVSLTCKTLNDVAEPLLYQSFRERNASSMGLFARAIISRPYLARYVRSFEGSTHRPNVRADPTKEGINLRIVSKTYPTDKQLEALRQSLPNSVYGEGFCTAWYGNLTNWFDNWDAFLGFLFQVCSRSLTSIGFQTVGVIKYPYLRTVLEQAVVEQHSTVEELMLSNLRKVNLKYDDRTDHRDRGITIEFVLPFFRLKSVDAISIEGLNGYVTPLTSEFSHQHVFAIKELTLTESRTSAALLEKLLQGFVSLRYFKYQHAPEGFPGNTPFRPRTIVNSLKQSKHCLERLFLSQKCRRSIPYSRMNDFDELHEPFGSLQSFERLRVVNVDTCVLLGPEHDDFSGEELEYTASQCMAAVAALPATLEALHITRCKSSIFGFLERVLPEENPVPFPKLRSINLLSGREIYIPRWPVTWGSWEKRAFEKDVVLTRTVFNERESWLG